MSKLILTRHGQSVWNAENRFTGWVDVDLSEKGISEAQKSGQLIKNLNINLDISYTSFLKRAIRTLTTILQENGIELKFITSWELNERHYGSLTGLNKEETKKKVGEEQFNNYRRSWDISPPPMKEDDENHFSGAVSAVVTDEPNTTSLVTYKVQSRAQNSETLYINRSENYANVTDTYGNRTVCSLEVTEIAG